MATTSHSSDRALSADRVDLYGLSRTELGVALARWGVNPSHAGLIWNRLYLALADGFGGMEGLPSRVRDGAAAHARIGGLQLARTTNSDDGFTRKDVLALDDGAVVEAVRMRFAGRVTACVSSQAGCAMGCVFCATGQRGFERNLTAGEIVAQAVHVQRHLRAAPDAGPGQGRLRNLVLMGMGEPLLNYDAVMQAVDILRDPSGMALGAGRITLSTVGIAPAIRRMADERRPMHLAVSLHAATQEERAALVPAARKWPLEELMDACRHYATTLKRRIFFEWTLIAGRNDGAEQARAVGRLIGDLPSQVNLIPLNPTGGYDGQAGRQDAARRFQSILAESFRIPCTIRQRRGIDIAAGCGQLAAAAHDTAGQR
jgi:23S rRNA (adenine2503-C2)-methyltransferase